MQIDGEDISPPVQFHPRTFPEQAELHLLRFEVSPSSQNSVETTFESPQIGLQIEGAPTAPVHCHPSTGPKQLDAHFVSPFVSPSSQVSLDYQMLSPQAAIGEQTEGVFKLPEVHIYPVIGTSQVASQYVT